MVVVVEHVVLWLILLIVLINCFFVSITDILVEVPCRRNSSWSPMFMMSPWLFFTFTDVLHSHWVKHPPQRLCPHQTRCASSEYRAHYKTPRNCKRGFWRKKIPSSERKLNIFSKMKIFKQPVVALVTFSVTRYTETPRQVLQRTKVSTCFFLLDSETCTANSLNELFSFFMDSDYSLDTTSTVY